MTALAPPALVLVTGGIRSGKSRFAERLAGQIGRSVLYVATATPNDPEMRARIARHRQRRPSEWRTIEVATNVAAAIEPFLGGVDAVLIEDLGNLVSNVMLAASRARSEEVAPLEVCREAIERELAGLERLRRHSRAVWLVVTHEVGAGLVPPNALGRQFVDLLGWANQTLSVQAEFFYLIIAGYAIDVTRLGRRVE